MPLIDPARSSFLLMGAGRYETDLPRVDSVGNNIRTLARLLTDQDGIGAPEERVHMLVDPADAGEVLSAVSEAADEAKDTLFLYYVGHGLLEGPPPGELWLTTIRTESRNLIASGVQFRNIAKLLEKSDAMRRVLFLDCCYGGQASADLGPHLGAPMLAHFDPGTAVGSFALFAAPPSFPAFAAPGEPHTGFTGLLVETLTEGLADGTPMLTLEDLYRGVSERAAPRTDLPMPMRLTNLAGDRIELGPNPARVAPGDASPIRRFGFPALSALERYVTLSQKVASLWSYSLKAILARPQILNQIEAVRRLQNYCGRECESTLSRFARDARAHAGDSLQQQFDIVEDLFDEVHREQVPRLSRPTNEVNLRLKADAETVEVSDDAEAERAEIVEGIRASLHRFRPAARRFRNTIYEEK